MVKKLDRRTVLKGAGGAVVGLPVLECMLNTHGEALAQTNAGLPKRYAIVFAGQSLGGDNFPKDRQRVNGQTITQSGHFIAPAEEGAGYTLTTPLLPLAGLEEDYSVVSNLYIPYSRSSTEPDQVPAAGAFRDFHGGASSPLLSGVRSTAANFRAEGPSSDQLVAGLQAGVPGRVGSLVYRAQPSWYLSGSSYSGRQYISYRAARDPITAQTSPQIAFGALFNGFTPSGADEQARHDFRQRMRTSVLDLISDKRERVLGRVSSADRVRLERHFDEIRALELRIQALPPVASGTCQVPTDPGTDPAIGGDNAGSGSDTIATNTGYSGETERARAFADLIHMAFVCDLTNVATLQITTFQSHMNVYPVTEALGLPIRADLHEVGHNGDADNRGQQLVSTVLRWHMLSYAHLLNRLRDTPEGAGNLLDNSAIIFMPEGGHGPQLNDGGVTDNQTHSTENMCLLVAGRAGGLQPGRHIRTQQAHPGSVLLSAMQAVGYTGNSFGEVGVGLPELFDGG